MKQPPADVRGPARDDCGDAAVAADGITVIIPAYNYARFLPDAIDSVLRQTQPVGEIIVVDDGSTDDTEQVLQSYHNRIRVIRQQNAGLSAARNTGIRAASGYLLAFLDADDVWLPDCAARLLQALREAGPQYGMVAGMQQLMNEQRQPIRRKPAFDAVRGSREITHGDLLVKSRFGASSVLVRRDCFETCGLFDKQLGSSEDRDMWLRIACRWRIWLLAEPVNLVRWHPESMSRNPARMNRAMRAVVQRAFAQLPPGGQRRRLRRAAMAFLHYEVAWMRHDAHDRRGALADLWQSLRLWPWFRRPDTLNEPLFFRLRTLRNFLNNHAD